MTSRPTFFALVRAYAETAQTYGGAVMTLLTDAPRHPELREAMAALMPNLLNAARLIETHQDRGQLAQGDPVQKLVMLIAPLLVSGLWARTGAAMPGAGFDPETFVADFLNGHRARLRRSPFPPPNRVTPVTKCDLWGWCYGAPPRISAVPPTESPHEDVSTSLA